MSLRCVKLLLVPLLLVTLSSAALADGDSPNPRFFPPVVTFLGYDPGEWGAMWWQWVYSIPVIEDVHPLITGGAFAGEGQVVFLAGPIIAPVTFTVELPPAKPLFFPIVNVECSDINPDPFYGADEAELRACAKGHIDNTSGLFAELDGRPVNNLMDYRADSPLFEIGPLPEDNILGVPAGTTAQSVSDGIYLMLAPLSVGEHTLRFGGTFDEFGASIDVTYIITVEP